MEMAHTPAFTIAIVDRLRASCLRLPVSTSKLSPSYLRCARVPAPEAVVQPTAPRSIQAEQAASLQPSNGHIGFARVDLFTEPTFLICPGRLTRSRTRARPIASGRRAGIILPLSTRIRT